MLYDKLYDWSDDFPSQVLWRTYGFCFFLLTHCLLKHNELNIAYRWFTIFLAHSLVDKHSAYNLEISLSVPVNKKFFLPQNNLTFSGALVHKAVRHPTARSREDSKPRDWMLWFSYTLSREYRVARYRYSRLLFTSEDRLCANLLVQWQ